MYKVFEDSSTYSLSKAVEKAMKDGWKCQGGLLVTYRTYRTYESNQVVDLYMQAMVKDSEVKQVL